MLNKIILRFFTGMAIFFAVPVFSQSIILNEKPFSLVNNSASMFEYNGTEPKVYINESFCYILRNFEEKNCAVLFKYKGNNNNLTKALSIDTIYFNENNLGSLQGFFTFNDKLVILFHSRLQIYKKVRSSFKILSSQQTDYDNIIANDNGYFVLCRYFNYIEKERKEINITSYTIVKDSLIKMWSYNENYKEIYYTHLSGNYIDLNSNGDFVITYPSEYKILVFNNKGYYKTLTKFDDNFPSNYHLKNNLEIFADEKLSQKEQIEKLSQLDSNCSRIQNIKFIDDNTFFIFKKSVELESDFRSIDIWSKESNGDFLCKKSDIKYRNEFEKISNVEEFYFTPCFSCSNKLYIKNNYVFLWDLYIPKKYLHLRSLPKIKSAVESYYSNLKPKYGLLKFKIEI